MHPVDDKNAISMTIDYPFLYRTGATNHTALSSRTPTLEEVFRKVVEGFCQTRFPSNRVAAASERIVRPQMQGPTLGIRESYGSCIGFFCGVRANSRG